MTCGDICNGNRVEERSKMGTETRNKKNHGKKKQSMSKQ